MDDIRWASSARDVAEIAERQKQQAVQEKIKTMGAEAQIASNTMLENLYKGQEEIRKTMDANRDCLLDQEETETKRHKQNLRYNRFIAAISFIGLLLVLLHY